MILNLRSEAMLRCSCCNCEAVLNVYDLCEECEQEVVEESNYDCEDSDYSFID